jgi:hypothetical protein
VLKFQRHLGYETVGCVEVFEHITERYSNSMRPLSHSQIDMVAEGQTMSGTFDLEVEVSACETERLESSRWVRDLNEVVG